VSRAVGVVLQSLNFGQNAVLVPLEINLAVVLLVPTAHMTGGDTAVGIKAARLGLLLEQGPVRRTLVQLVVNDVHDKAATG
jgi:hypothetical protein